MAHCPPRWLNHLAIRGSFSLVNVKLSRAANRKALLSSRVKVNRSTGQNVTQNFSTATRYRLHLVNNDWKMV